MFERRLVTSGCSCTEHSWPTWAKYLGLHFHDHINVAVSGADNATIARNVIAEARPGDVVVILWSSFNRFNTFEKDRTQRTDRPGDKNIVWYSGMNVNKDQTTVEEIKSGGWHHSGSLYHDRPFITYMYHSIERFRTTLDYVKMVEMHSIIKGYNVWNFSMTDWFLGGIEKNPDPRLLAMHERSDLNHFYLKSNLQKVRQDVLPITVKLPRGNDSHPTPWVHWKWLIDHVAPEMGIELDPEIGKIAEKDHEDLLVGQLVI